jgi:hypothetical protein
MKAIIFLLVILGTAFAVRIKQYNSVQAEHIRQLYDQGLGIQEATHQQTLDILM